VIRLVDLGVTCSERYKLDWYKFRAANLITFILPLPILLRLTVASYIRLYYPFGKGPGQQVKNISNLQFEVKNISNLHFELFSHPHSDVSHV